jgi:hypothetical protein
MRRKIATIDARSMARSTDSAFTAKPPVVGLVEKEIGSRIRAAP